MLFNGEQVGNGRGPACDIAVDPIDGTSLTAAGRQNALSVIAVSDRGTMLDASSVFYMDKIVTGSGGPRRGRHPAADRREHPRAGEGARASTSARSSSPCSTGRGMSGSSTTSARPAPAPASCSTATSPAASTRPATRARIDMCVGIGGSPEGITTACAIKALGGFIQGRLAPAR